MNIGPYTKQNRLAEVLALIQVLALDPHTRREESGIRRELKGAPTSAKTWFDLASEHREFFRLDKEEGAGLSLISRYVVIDDENAERPTLSPELSKLLLDT